MALGRYTDCLTTQSLQSLVQIFDHGDINITNIRHKIGNLAKHERRPLIAS